MPSRRLLRPSRPHARGQRANIASALPGTAAPHAPAPRRSGGVRRRTRTGAATIAIVDDVATDDPPLMNSPVAHIGALEVLVDVLSQGEEGAAGDEFYGRLCEAVCRLTSMDRAVIFRY